MRRILFILMILLFTMISCSEQSITRRFGGTVRIDLPKGERLINATWKEVDLFYLTEPMDSDYIPKTKTFRESSSLGVFESKVLFIESK